MKWYIAIIVDTMPIQFLTPTGMKEFSKPEEERLQKMRRRYGSNWRIYDSIGKAQVFTNKSEAERVAAEVPHSKVLSEMGLIRHA